MYYIVQPKILYMGRGALQGLEKILRLMEPRRILIITGPTVTKLGIVDRAVQAMGSYKHRVETFIEGSGKGDMI